MEENSFSNNNAGAAGYPQAKSEHQTSASHFMQKLIQNGSELK